MDRERHGFVAGLIFGLVGIGILVITAIALLIAPIVVWFAWNVLDFGKSIGAGDLGFWGIILLSIFLVGGGLHPDRGGQPRVPDRSGLVLEGGHPDVAGHDLQALGGVA